MKLDCVEALLSPDPTYVSFRWVNTEPSMQFRKANTDPSVQFRRANTETVNFGSAVSALSVSYRRLRHSISNRFFQCFSCIIDRVCQKTPTVQIWWEKIESQYRIPNLGQTIRNRPCNLGQTIRNRPCNLGQTIRIRPCNSGRPIRTRPCNLGGAIRNSCFAKC